MVLRSVPDGMVTVHVVLDIAALIVRVDTRLPPIFTFKSQTTSLGFEPGRLAAYTMVKVAEADVIEEGNEFHSHWPLEELSTHSPSGL
jgi:hypothetical protein